MPAGTWSASATAQALRALAESRIICAAGSLIEQVGADPLLLGREVTYRAARVARQRVLARFYDRLIGVRSAPRLRPLRIDLPTRAHLDEQLPGAAERVLAAAEAASRHEFDLFGSGPTALGDRIDWHCDFKSGYRWPRAPYQQVLVTRLDDRSDAKVPWELSRCHHFLALARAARIFSEPTYRDELVSAWESWLADNPVGIGINWTNPMEVAIRAVNWAWALNTLGDAGLPSSLRERVASSLLAHGRHIAWNLEGTPRLRSNHYLADAMGLLVIGAVLEGREARTMFRRGRTAFEREIQRQVLPDGMGFEASTGYHGLCLEMFLLADWVAAQKDASMSQRYRGRLRRMVAASRTISASSGEPPRFGDCDDGRILPIDQARPFSHDHLLWAAASTLGEPPPSRSSGAADAALVYGDLAQSGPMPAPPAVSVQTCAAFEEAGFWVLRGVSSELFVRAGDVGQNGNGGHAHNDCCSFTLSAKGVPLIVDPGTFVYTADPSARNRFRSTAVHNTIEVAGLEINPIEPSRLFQLRPFARPRRDLWRVSDREAVLQVSHDGYRRIPQKVRHRRTFCLDRHADCTTITDRLSGSGWLRAKARVQLAPGSELTRRGDRFQVGCEGVTFSIVSDMDGSVVEAQVSTGYGREVAAPRLEFDLSGALPLEYSFSLEIAR